MYFLIITLLIISISLFILSFFMNDRFQEIENQIEHLSLSNLQDTYQLKQKLKVLEEELLPNSLDFNADNKNKSSLENQIMNLYKQGYTVSEISKTTQLSEYDIKSIIS